MFSTEQASNYTDLAVFGFTELAAPLTGNADGLVSFLGYAGLVENEAAVFTATDKRFGIAGYLIDAPLLVPRRIG